MRMTTRLKQLITSGQTAMGATAYDGLTAKLVCEAGFDVIGISGFQVSASMGVPDAELYSMSEMLSSTRAIVDSSTVPVIADCDTGYGNAINVMRTVREFERMGVAGLFIEDQASPKRCPLLMDPELNSIEESVGKIRAAVKARQDPDLVIIARTDATTVDEACRRGKAYAQAGADMILTISRCTKTYEDLVRIREAAGVPLLLILTGWTEGLSAEQLGRVAGAACYGTPTLMTVTQSLRTNLAALRKNRSSANLPIPMTSFDDFKKFIGFPEMERIQNEYMPPVQ